MASAAGGHLDWKIPPAIFMLGLCGFWAAPQAPADEIVHRDGRVLDGQFARISKTAEDPLANIDPEASTPIFLCDNDLTRTFVPYRLLRENTFKPAADPLEKIKIPQRVADGDNRVACVGPFLGMQPFDEFGRRTVEISTAAGPVKVIQGITTLTSRWAKVEGLNAGGNLVWDMRIATSSIPRDTLSKIVRKFQGGTEPNLNHRLKLVRLLIDAERYRDAEVELQDLAKTFPDDPLPKQVLGTIQQLGAKTLLREIELRRNSGQHQLANSLLRQFPQEGLSGVTQQQIKQILEEDEQLTVRRDALIAELGKLAADLPSGTRELWAEPVAEICRELSRHNIERLAPYENLRGDKNLRDEQKLALAVTGWLAGPNSALNNPLVGLSLYKTRNLVRDYLLEKNSLKRAELLQLIQQEEANSVELLTRIIRHMTPVWPLPPAAELKEVQTLEVPGQPNQPNYSYQVLLPPEYDPYRSYPAIVCLHAQGMTPAQELTWWAGEATPRGRFGQATRHGYIVIAPAYTDGAYSASPEEHERVTKTLRDACRRFNIDSDRIFLSGHSQGANAAWDIGLSHPDLWAGVIPINGMAIKESVAFYQQNASILPLYFVHGELDCGVIKVNAPHWDKYFSRAFDITVVQYLGRGHENFSDEILRLFDWMNRKNRARDLRLFPAKYKITTRRPTDNYFWSLEVRDFGVQNMARGVEIEQEIKGNSVIIRGPAQAKVSIWLSPEMVSFNSEIKIIYNGQSLVRGKSIPASEEILLEDVRTRGERQHPFWAVVEN
ncbi:MAG: peptidase [Pirellulales bacterium]|nr:peptidase [Pirellulales bacterium]